MHQAIQALGSEHRDPQKFHLECLTWGLVLGHRGPHCRQESEWGRRGQRPDSVPSVGFRPPLRCP